MTKSKQTWHNIEGRFNLAGVQYSDYQLVCGSKGLKPGTVCKIFWERSNPVDGLALKVYCNNIHIGYVPKGSIYQSELHRHHQKGDKCIAVLTACNKTNPTWMMFTVQCKYRIGKVSKVPERMVEI